MDYYRRSEEVDVYEPVEEWHVLRAYAGDCIFVRRHFGQYLGKRPGG